MDTTADDIAHVHIDSGKTRAIKSRRHFDLTIDALLTQDGDTRLRV